MCVKLAAAFGSSEAFRLRFVREHLLALAQGDRRTVLHVVNKPKAARPDLKPKFVFIPWQEREEEAVESGHPNWARRV